MTHPPTATVIKNPTWWRRRTQLERVLTLLVVFAVGLCVILTAALALTNYKQLQHESVETIVTGFLQSTYGHSRKMMYLHWKLSPEVLGMKPVAMVSTDWYDNNKYSPKYGCL